MCVSRASLACCDCYPQRLFGKLGAATAVSGFRAKELDPYHRRCRTVHQGIEATTPDEPRVGNAKISTCTVVSISHFGGRPPQTSTTRSSRQERRRNAELGLLRQRRQKTRQPRELQANAGRQPSEMLSHRQLLYLMFQRSDTVPSTSPPGQRQILRLLKESRDASGSQAG